MSTLEDEILDKLECKTIKQLTSLSTSGCINVGHVYLLDNQRKIFVKKNNDPIADVMFKGEQTSLEAILATNTVQVPKPLALVTDPATDLSVILMDYIEDLGNLRNQQEKLGEQLAGLHRENYIKLRRAEKARSWIKEQPVAVEEYGFDAVTCCGQIPLENDWHSDWAQFYARNRIDHQIKLVLESHNDRTCIEEWGKLQLKIDKLFLDKNDEPVKLYPALLHGDLWIGNAGETAEAPVVYDPASFYGHSEFDLAIGYVFRGFSAKFYDAYFGQIAKADGFDVRQHLYQLFHYLNHWNHFGHSYRAKSIELIKKLNAHLYKS